MSFTKKLVLISVVMLMSTMFLPNNPISNVKPVTAWSGNTHGWLSEVAIRLMPEPWSTDLMEETTEDSISSTTNASPGFYFIHALLALIIPICIYQIRRKQR
ncbi:hypothetical protein KA005_70010 [bacterium]|nr:hypothetical protein [bacterium]